MNNLVPIRLPRPSNNRILLVEEDTELAPVLELLLGRAGCEVIRAGDGRQAAQLIDRLAPPGLVLLEIFLPYRGGFELLQQIRGRSSWNGVPVVMLSNNAGGTDTALALARGAQACLLKPLCPKTILAWMAVSGGPCDTVMEA